MALGAAQEARKAARTSQFINVQLLIWRLQSGLRAAAFLHMVYGLLADTWAIQRSILEASHGMGGRRGGRALASRQPARAARLGGGRIVKQDGVQVEEEHMLRPLNDARRCGQKAC